MAPFLKYLARHRIFSLGKEEKHGSFGCTHPVDRQRFPISTPTSLSPLGNTQPTTALKNPSHYLPKHEAVQCDPHGPDIQSLQSEESMVSFATDSVCKEY